MGNEIVSADQTDTTDEESEDSEEQNDSNAKIVYTPTYDENYI